MKDYPPPKNKSKKKKKKKKQGSGSLPALRSGCATTITLFFAHLLILQYPDHHQNLISSSLYYSGPVHKISSQSVHNFLSNVVHRQTNKQTNRQTDKLTNATKNITSFAKEVMNQALGPIIFIKLHTCAKKIARTANTFSEVHFQGCSALVVFASLFVCFCVLVLKFSI